MVAHDEAARRLLLLNVADRSTAHACTAHVRSDVGKFDENRSYQAPTNCADESMAYMPVFG